MRIERREVVFDEVRKSLRERRERRRRFHEDVLQCVGERQRGGG